MQAAMRAFCAGPSDDAYGLEHEEGRELSKVECWYVISRPEPRLFMGIRLNRDKEFEGW